MRRSWVAHLGIVESARISGGDSVQELNVLSVRHLILADLVRVAHRAEAALRLKIAGITRVTDSDPLHRHCRGGHGKQYDNKQEH